MLAQMLAGPGLARSPCLRSAAAQEQQVSQAKPPLRGLCFAHRELGAHRQGQGRPRGAVFVVTVSGGRGRARRGAASPACSGRQPPLPHPASAFHAGAGHRDRREQRLAGPSTTHPHVRGEAERFNFQAAATLPAICIDDETQVQHIGDDDDDGALLMDDDVREPPTKTTPAPDAPDAPT